MFPSTIPSPVTSVTLAKSNKPKIAFILGNGFNFLLQNIINKYPDSQIPHYISTSKSEVSKNLGEITILWKKFDDLLKGLRSQYNQVNDEELIRMIYTVIDFFSSIDAFKKVLSTTQIDAIKKTFDFLLIEKIRDIAEEFRKHQNNNAGYRDIKVLFPDFGMQFAALVNKNNFEYCDFFTTNYDGILDTLLTKSGVKGFLSVDGFGTIQNDPKYLRLYDDNFQKSNIRIIHIHGSYRFEKKYGDTFKAKNSNDENMDPVIIFNNPQMKEQLIRRDPVLSHYFTFMAKSIQEADKLVIIGNSMTNEPHIKAIIKNKFNQPDQKLYVCSRKPSEISAQLTPHYTKAITERDTSQINTINDLLDFFESIFNDPI